MFRDNKIFVLILFLMFIMWSTFILLFIWLDDRVTRIDKYLFDKVEVINDIDY